MTYDAIVEDSGVGDLVLGGTTPTGKCEPEKQQRNTLSAVQNATRTAGLVSSKDTRSALGALPSKARSESGTESRGVKTLKVQAAPGFVCAHPSSCLCE